MAIKFVSPDKLTLAIDKIKALIPKKTSDLTNDSGYITMAQVPEGAVASTTEPKMDGVANTGTESAFARGDHVHPSDTNKVDKVTGKQLSTNDYTTAEKNKLAGIAENANNYSLPKATATVLGGVKIGANIEIDSEGKISVKSITWANVEDRPTKLSEFTNDSGFITKAVSDLTNYYSKSDVYTKTEVTNLMGQIKTIQIQTVDQLPTTGQSNVIYLVPKQGGTGTNVKDEYLWTGTAFEKIGDTEIDLSGYWKKEDLVECTDADINAMFTS